MRHSTQPCTQLFTRADHQTHVRRSVDSACVHAHSSLHEQTAKRTYTYVAQSTQSLSMYAALHTSRHQAHVRTSVDSTRVHVRKSTLADHRTHVRASLDSVCVHARCSLHEQTTRHTCVRQLTQPLAMYASLHQQTTRHTYVRRSTQLVSMHANLYTSRPPDTHARHSTQTVSIMYTALYTSRRHQTHVLWSVHSACVQIHSSLHEQTTRPSVSTAEAAPCSQQGTFQYRAHQPRVSCTHEPSQTQSVTWKALFSGSIINQSYLAFDERLVLAEIAKESITPAKLLSPECE